MEYDKLVENDIFPIPVGDEFGKDSNEINIVYSPLTDRAILVTHEYLDMMNSYMVQPENRELLPESITEVMNSLCDFENRKKPEWLSYPTMFATLNVTIVIRHMVVQAK